MSSGRGTARSLSGDMERLPLDLPVLVRQVLAEDPDTYTALSVVLNHARGLTGFGSGAVLRLTDAGELEVIASQGRASTMAVKAFRPGHGRLAALWSVDAPEPTASVAILSDVGGANRFALAYTLLPITTMPKVVMFLARSVPESMSASEAVPRADVEKLKRLAKVATPLLEHVEEHARLRRELVEMKRRAQDAKAAVRTRDAFLARMSHDLRTPLSSIIGFAQLLEMEQLEPEQRSHVNRILRSGRKLNKLLTQAIEIAYAAAGKLTLMLQPVDLLALVKDCVSMVRTDAAEAGVTVSVTPPSLSEPVVISTDAQRVSQVLLNLLSNAINASEKKQTVTVTLTLGEETVSVEVADRGPGIPPQLLPRLFIPFAAADPDGSAEASLGLPLSHTLATVLGGSLSVDSELGAGARFTLTLPRR